MTVTVSPNRSEQWIRTRDRKTGRPLFVAVPSQSVPGLYHLVSLAGCDCRGFAYRQTCRHFRQVQAEAAERATKPAAPSAVGTISTKLDRVRCLADDVWGVDGE